MALVCCIGLGCWAAACGVWACYRCCQTGGLSSRTWREATLEEFKDVPRLCRVLLAVYERDLKHPKYGNNVTLDQIVKKAGYDETDGMCPPYMIYIDHDAGDICLAVRGLNTSNCADYRVLLDNKKGKQKFDGGYVHHGLLHAAAWILDQEEALLRELAARHPRYTVTLAGHSLGSGIVSLMAVLLKKHARQSPFAPSRIRCYGIAPARSTSLNLAVRYADTINSVVLQDDFLPRTSTPVELIFASSVCLPCMLCYQCLRDVTVTDSAKLKDPRRLYTPGRLYHILYTKPFNCKEQKPVVRTAVPVDLRFEHLVFSPTMVNDHSIVNIEHKADAALRVLVLKEEEIGGSKSPPEVQRMERRHSMMVGQYNEHHAALERAQSLGVANAKVPGEIKEPPDRDAGEEEAEAFIEVEDNGKEVLEGFEVDETEDKRGKERLKMEGSSLEDGGEREHGGGGGEGGGDEPESGAVPLPGRGDLVVELSRGEERGQGKPRHWQRIVDIMLEEEGEPNEASKDEASVRRLFSSRRHGLRLTGVDST